MPGSSVRDAAAWLAQKRFAVPSLGFRTTPLLASTPRALAPCARFLHIGRSASARREFPAACTSTATRPLRAWVLIVDIEHLMTLITSYEPISGHLIGTLNIEKFWILFCGVIVIGVWFRSVLPAKSRAPNYLADDPRNTHPRVPMDFDFLS